MPLWTSARIKATIGNSNEVQHILVVFSSVSCSSKTWEGTRKGFQEKLIFVNPYLSVVVHNVRDSKYITWKII